MKKNKGWIPVILILCAVFGFLTVDTQAFGMMLPYHNLGTTSGTGSASNRGVVIQASDNATISVSARILAETEQLICQELDLDGDGNLELVCEAVSASGADSFVVISSEAFSHVQIQGGNAIHTVPVN